MLKDRIREDMKDAMKKREENRLRALRLLMSAIKNFEIAEGREAVDEDVQSIVLKEMKKRQEAIEAYEKAGRDDLAQQERKELEVLSAYAPRMMSEDEIRAEALKAIGETGASSPRDVGKVMRLLMPRIKGRADGKVVNRIVLELLKD